MKGSHAILQCVSIDHLIYFYYSHVFLSTREKEVLQHLSD